MKKLLCIILAVLLAAVALAGCSKKEEDEPAPESSAVVSTPKPEAKGPYQVGLVQYMDYAPYDEAREAFMSRLEEWGYGDSRLQVDYQNAGGDSAKLEEICEKFAKDGKDVVVAISAPAAKAAAGACEGTDTKVVFLGITDPGSLGIADPVNPGGSVTGVADLVTARSAVELAMQANSAIKTVGLIYDPGCPFGEDYLAAMRAYCTELSLTIVESQVTGKDQVEAAMKDLCGQVDAVFSPLDSTLSAAGQEAAKAARDSGKPWYASSEDTVAVGALASINIDYTDAGNKAADMAVQLVSGKTVKELAVYVYPKGRVSVNQEVMDALLLRFPEEVLETANYIQAQKQE